MEYRKLPHGSERVSVIGLGTSVVGEHSVQNVVETVTFALDSGVNYIDLAGGHAAIFPGIGEALAGRRKDAYVQLHFGADYTSGEYGWNPTLDGVKKSVAWQLEQLKTDYIDFGFMHCLDEIGEQIRRTLGLSMTAAQMESVLRGDAVHINEDARKIIDRQADAYVHRLLSAITESGLDTRAMPAVFLGGGAALLKRTVSAADGLCRPVILDDVSLNAKGYERLAERLTKNDEQ